MTRDELRLVGLQVTDKMPGQPEVVRGRDFAQGLLYRVLAKICLACTNGRLDGSAWHSFRDRDEPDVEGVPPGVHGGIVDDTPNDAQVVRNIEVFDA